ncbi:DUF4124 domain-containing protein [Thiohalomonas denitrificans]|uniref:DUF4124 domain-containing protein n=1 Tax=Thiohalomonas denitrificans TaxID=415747 RepID=A0A1G5QMY5_9GAMM|nr:DUF4124 domain-containing protein [Thiohalomonas denitrificans]SCZ62920.1 protein of unknown function [Thiohalomonas denitrificans]
MTRSNAYRTLIATICLVLAAPAVAKMYKWTDNEGNIHYSQIPPEGREAREIAAPPKVRPQQAEEPAQDKTAQPEGEESAKEPELTPEQQAEREQLYRRNCDAAQKNLKLFQNARRIMENGELVIITEEDRAKRLESTREQIEKYCNP